MLHESGIGWSVLSLAILNAIFCTAALEDIALLISWIIEKMRIRSFMRGNALAMYQWLRPSASSFPCQKYRKAPHVIEVSCFADRKPKNCAYREGESSISDERFREICKIATVCEPNGWSSLGRPEIVDCILFLCSVELDVKIYRCADALDGVSSNLFIIDGLWRLHLPHETTECWSEHMGPSYMSRYLNDSKLLECAEMIKTLIANVTWLPDEEDVHA